MMSAEDVAALVTDKMEATKAAYPAEFDGVGIDILSVQAMTWGDAMRSQGNPQDEGFAAGGEWGRAVWLVTADGPFMTARGLGPLRFGTTGYYVIEDATGESLGMGFGP